MNNLFIIILVALIALVAPMALIWCLNVLFGTAILFTFKTWFAALLIIAMFAPSLPITTWRE